MRHSKNYNLLLPERVRERNDPGDIDDLTFDVESIDSVLKVQDDEDKRLERDKLDKADHNRHKTAVPIDHPDGSVTDAKLGNRTVLTTSGTLQTLLTAIGNAIKAIVGAATWNSAPPITLTDTKAHTVNVANPHKVTKAQVGLGNADNTSDANKPVSTAQAAAIKVVQDDVTAHENLFTNPHKVTKAQVGLGNADNTSDANKPVSTAQQTALDNKVDKITGKGLSTEDYTSAEKGAVAANSAARHTHGNKSVLDGLTAALVSNWNAAFTHVADAVRHITAAERTLWNSVATKLGLTGGTLTGFLTLHANPTANLHAATKQYVDNSVSDLGGGDMLKTVYDTTNNGVVDKAETVAWGGVTGKPSTFTPSSHTHDDRYFTEAEIDGKLATKEPVFIKNTAFNKNFGTAAGTVCQGNDARLSNARPANGGNADSVPWSGVTGKPTSFAPAAHKHATSDVTGLDAQLSSKANQDNGTVTLEALDTLMETCTVNMLSNDPNDKSATRSALWTVRVDASNYNSNPQSPSVVQMATLTYQAASMYTLGAVLTRAYYLAADGWTAWSPISRSFTFHATIGTGWTDHGSYFTQWIPVPGLLASDNPIIDLEIVELPMVTGESILENWDYVFAAVCGNDRIAFYAHGTIPNVAMPIQLKVVR